MRVTRFGVLVCLCGSLAIPSALWGQAQVTTGVIQGVVMDETGAVVVGASVIVKNLGTNLERNLSTDSAGRFVSLQLPAGRYTVEVSKEGFSTLVQENLSLTVGQTISLSLTLKVSPVAERVVVSETSTVDIVRTESSSTLNELSVSNTPVLGRKFENLFTLTPGVSIVQGPDGDEISFAGQRGIFNNISLDGGDYINGFFGEQLGGQRPAIDITMEAVKEFQVVATGGSAEFGRTASGIVNVITKSGTNELHGSLFHFQRLEALSANTSDGKPLKDFSREQFGGSIGGPIVKDKMFFFGTFEQIIEDLTRPNLSEPIGTLCSVSEPTILANEALLRDDPLTRQPVNADCQRLALINFFRTTLSQEEGNPVEHPIRASSLVGKFDWTITSGHDLGVTYNFTRSKNDNQTFDVATYGNSANGIEGPANIQSVRMNLFSTVSPTKFNEGHFTYSREERPRAAVTSTVPADIAMGVATAFRFGNPFFLQPTIDELFWRTHIKDNFSIVAGKHTIKFGGEWIHSLNDQIFRGFFTGRYIFDSVVGFLRYASNPALGAGFGPTVAACADGITFTDIFAPTCTLANNPFTFGPGPLVLYLQGAGRTGPATDAAGASKISNEEYAFFIQDKWQVRPNFTLNLGLRWEAQLMPETVDPTTTAYAFALGNPLFPSNGTIPDQTNMWQPRVAFAWDILNNRKSVFRGSWGVYYARQNMLSQVGSVTANGIQQQTIFLNTAIIGFGAPPPVVPGVVTPAAGSCGTNPFPCFTGVRVFSADYENPRVYSVNANYEQEFRPHWAFYVDFTWAKGVHMTRFININRADRGSPFSLQLGEVMVASSMGKSLYRGFSVGMKKRFSQGFQLEWNYALSKDQDDDSNERDPFTDRSSAPVGFVQADYSLSDRDIKHKFNFFTYADLPRGFQANVRVQGRTAQPISPVPRLPGNRNTLRKDTEYFSVDWRVARPFKLGERYTLIPMVEMFNTFNSKNNINPLITPGLFNFDGFLRQGVGDPLQLQVAVKFTF